MTSTYDLYRRVITFPLGATAFSIAFARKAPYFRSVRPHVLRMEPHHAQVRVPKRRAVLNHIGTVHAIAACNGLEAAMGLLAEATVPQGWRWLPKGMEVRYTAKSTTDLVCTATSDPDDWAAGGDVPVRVVATLDDGTVAVEGTIHLWVTAKKPAAAAPA